MLSRALNIGPVTPCNTILSGGAGQIARRQKIGETQ